MRLPIALGLGWPDRLPDAASGLRLDHRLDVGRSCPWTTRRSPRWPSPGTSGQEGATYPAVFNAANEECVEAFLAGSIPFLAIVDTVARVVEEWAGQAGNDPGELSVESVLRAEAWARARARQVLVEVPRETVKS